MKILQAPPPQGLRAILLLAFAALALPAAAAEPVNIARVDGTTKKVVNASGTEGSGFSGGTGLSMLFDGNLKAGTRLRDIGSGGYIQLDFQEPYFVTTIDVTKWYRHKYSLSLSSDGTTWEPVDYATAVNRYGTKTWGVYKAASHVRMSFPEGSTHCEDVAELEVWGVAVSGMECNHESISSWTEVPNSATCTTAVSEQARCSTCGEVFVRESGSRPLGHDYTANVLEPGKGWFSCKRCDEQINCMDGEVDLTLYGKMTFDDTYVQFVDLLTSTLDRTEGDGTPSILLFDNDVNTTWTSTQRGSGVYAQISFKTQVRLTKVVMTVSGWDGMFVTSEMKALEGAQEADNAFFTGRVQLSGGGTITAEFSEQDINAFRIYFSNNWNDFISVKEIRVYGTVPGEVNYKPMFLLMQ